MLVRGSEVVGGAATRKRSVVDGGDTEGVVVGVLEIGIMSTGEDGGSVAVVVGEGGGVGASGGGEVGASGVSSNEGREVVASVGGFTTG